MLECEAARAAGLPEPEHPGAINRRAKQFENVVQMQDFGTVNKDLVRKSKSNFPIAEDDRHRTVEFARKALKCRSVKHQAKGAELMMRMERINTQQNALEFAAERAMARATHPSDRVSNPVQVNVQVNNGSVSVEQQEQLRKLPVAERAKALDELLDAGNEIAVDRGAQGGKGEADCAKGADRGEGASGDRVGVVSGEPGSLDAELGVDVRSSGTRNADAAVPDVPASGGGGSVDRGGGGEAGRA
jgi:hypothetical protein